MKTLDETVDAYNKQATERLEAAAAYQADVQRWLEEIEAADIAPFDDNPLTIQRRDRARDLIRRGIGRRLDILCTGCNTQLAIPNPHKVLPTLRPKQTLTCPGCGFAQNVPIDLVRGHSA